jgi:hypothetical protein
MRFSDPVRHGKELGLFAIKVLCLADVEREGGGEAKLE